MPPTEFEYIRFEEIIKPDRKTSTWIIFNKRFETILGTIRWWSHWRQYVFFPQESTIFSVGCLKDIQTFISQAMQERKDSHAN